MLDWSERLKVYFVKEQIDTVLNKESAVRLTHLQLHSQGLSPHCVFFFSLWQNHATKVGTLQQQQQQQKKTTKPKQT